MLYKVAGHATTLELEKCIFPCDAPGRTARLLVALADEARSETLDKSCRERRVLRYPFRMDVAVRHFYPDEGRAPVHNPGACLIDAPSMHPSHLIIVRLKRCHMKRNCTMTLGPSASDPLYMDVLTLEPSV